MAKLNRERGLVERRMEKQARKAARKQAALHEKESGSQAEPVGPDQPLANQPEVDAAVQALDDLEKR